jgi:hypothetical protein
MGPPSATAKSRYASTASGSRSAPSAISDESKIHFPITTPLDRIPRFERQWIVLDQRPGKMPSRQPPR